MLVRATQIVTAGLVLVGADVAWAQAGASRVAPPSPYHAPAAAPLPAGQPVPPLPPPYLGYEGGNVPPSDLSSGPPDLSFHAVGPGPGMPLGESLRLNFGAMVDNGTAARMTLYDYDFECGTAILNFRGRQRARLLGAKAGAVPFPIVIEQLPFAPQLAAARRGAVLQELALAGLPVAPGRVLVGAPVAVPLRGVEAELIYQTLMTQTGSAGLQPGTPATGGNRQVQPAGTGAPPISR